EERLEVFVASLPRPDTLEDLRRPRRALAALGALRAALMREEARGSRDKFHKILRVVDDDHAAGAEHRPLRDESFVVHQRRFGFRECLDRYRDATGNDRLELPARQRTAAQL